MGGFTPTCTTPELGTRFVSAPPTRGTIQILWGCLSILILCTWSVQHLNLPLQARPQDAWQRFRRKYFRIRKKSKWMVVAILAPEYTMGKAFADLCSAMYHSECMKSWADKDCVQWSLTHTFFANMGGFTVHFPNSLDLQESNSGDEQLSQMSLRSRKSARFAERFETHAAYRPPLGNSGLHIYFKELQNDPGFDLNSCAHLHNCDAISMGYIDWAISPRNRSQLERALKDVHIDQITRSRYLAFYQNLLVLQGDSWIVDAPQLLLLRELGIIDSLPSLTEDDLEDKNKGDSLVKAAALIQITWLALQLCVRFARHLASSQLEIVTLAFALCSIITFLLLLNKPQDCQTSVQVKAVKFPTVQQMISIADKGPLPIVGFIRRRHWMPGNMVHECKPGVNQVIFAAAGNAAGATLFGALHCLAWNSYFPTRAEQRLWRISCVVSAAMPLTGLLIHWSARRLFYCLFRNSHRLQHHSSVALITILGIPYLLARLFITAEVFRTLFYLPPEAYITTWASNLPHIN